MGAVSSCVFAEDTRAAHERAARVGGAASFLAAALDIVGEHVAAAAAASAGELAPAAVPAVELTPAALALADPSVPEARMFEELPSAVSETFIRRAAALSQRNVSTVDSDPARVRKDFGRRFAGSLTVRIYRLMHSAGLPAPAAVAAAAQALARQLPAGPRREFLACMRAHNAVSVANGAAAAVQHWDARRVLERELLLCALDHAIEAEMSSAARTGRGKPSAAYARRGDLLFCFAAPATDRCLPVDNAKFSRILFEHVLKAGDTYSIFTIFANERNVPLDGVVGLYADVYAVGDYALTPTHSGRYCSLRKLVQLVAEKHPTVLADDPCAAYCSQSFW